jgi:hypothetical protein
MSEPELKRVYAGNDRRMQFQALKKTWVDLDYQDPL